jgi:hypothetical protein
MLGKRCHQISFAIAEFHLFHAEIEDNYVLVHRKTKAKSAGSILFSQEKQELRRTSLRMFISPNNHPLPLSWTYRDGKCDGSSYISALHLMWGTLYVNVSLDRWGETLSTWIRMDHSYSAQICMESISYTLPEVVHGEAFIVKCSSMTWIPAKPKECQCQFIGSANLIFAN